MMNGCARLASSCIQGKCAFITGGAQGFGKAFSKALLLQDTKVCLADINTTVGIKTRDELKSETKNENVEFIRCDVTNDESFRGAVQTAIRQFGGIDIFVNNAGIADEINWTKCIDVNQIGVIRGTNLALEHMRKDKGGNGGLIINVSSMAALVPLHAAPTYSATKSAVVTYTSAVAASPYIKEAETSLVCICPAFAETEMIKTKDSKLLDPAYVKLLIEKMGILKLDTVVDAFLKLIEDNINGSVLSVTPKGVQYVNDKKSDTKL